MSFRAFHPALLTPVASAVLSAMLLAACAPPALWADPRTPAASPVPALPTETAGVAAGASAFAPTGSVTAEPFALELTALPTQTALPTLELPTQAGPEAGTHVWDGLPTYPAESRPDFYFRLHFDPNAWALTSDQYGYPVLAHRDITDCVITPAAGRGLPLNSTVDHDQRRIGGINFQTSTAYVNGVRQFVNYAGGNGIIFTAFQVSLDLQADRCLAAAEVALGTLGSVPVLEATPLAPP